jgi:hypothetical protein
LAWLALLPACPSLHEWEQDQDRGLQRIYLAPFPAVWEAVPAAIHDLGLNLVHADKKRRYVLAENTANSTSYGERVAVLLDELDRDHTRVHVISKRRWTNDLLAGNWEQPILNQLSVRLETPTATKPPASAESNQH